MKFLDLNLRSLMLRMTAFVVVVVGVSDVVQSQDDKTPKHKIAFVHPNQVDADFAFQGEYLGDLNGKPTAAQVIAQGGGKFKIWFLHGGLPGDGANGKKTEVTEMGERREDEVVFEEKNISGRIRQDMLTVFTPNFGDKIGVLKKRVRKSPTLGAKPPKDSVVLFDGSGVDQWEKGKMSDDKLLMQGTTSKKKFGDHHLHIEFRLPYMPYAKGQQRGNSGLYLQGRYEVQMLDSFGLKGKHNECGGIYSVKDPDLNMCYPPLTWQTYDIDFTAAKFEGEGQDRKVVTPAKMTVRHNGVVIHKDVALPSERGTTASPVKPGPEKGPVYLQNHGNPVRYRNVWVTEK